MWCNLVGVYRRLGKTLCRLEDGGRLYLYLGESGSSLGSVIVLQPFLYKSSCNQCSCITPRSKPKGSSNFDSAVTYFKTPGFKLRLVDRLIWCVVHGFFQYLHANVNEVPVIMLYLEYAGSKFLGSGGKCLQKVPERRITRTSNYASIPSPQLPFQSIIKSAFGGI